MFSRRAYLSTIGVLGLAGCAGSAEDGTTTTNTTGTTEGAEETRDAMPTETPEQSLVEIPEITVQNLHREPHRFHVLVFEGESPVFWRSHRAEAAEWEDGWVEEATGTVWKDPLPGPGEYSVHVRIDDRQEWRSWSASEDSRSCFYLELEVEPNGSFHMQAGFPC